MPRDIPTAPTLAELPSPVLRRRRCGGSGLELKVHLRTVTPVMGGGVVARDPDLTDIIRVPTIRGHLRQWWRALRDQPKETSEDLFRAEASLWGRTGDKDGGRSEVEIRVCGRPEGGPAAQGSITAARAYALWPAAKTQTGLEEARLRPPGLTFTLSIALYDRNREQEVSNAVRAWILFGGYGARSRRGVGSLTATISKHEWLPDIGANTDVRRQTADQLRRLFGSNPLASPTPAPLRPYPALAGASLLLGAHTTSGGDAWETALRWMRQFRQGEGDGRDNGPGRSRWPEADKLRHLDRFHRTHSHTPLYNDHPIWPRANLGLPIVGRFRKEDENDPPPFTITWESANQKVQDRMASPVIVKALPTVQGYRPCVLWLARSMPPGKVGAYWTEEEKQLLATSRADFDDRLNGYDQGVATRPGHVAPLTGTTTVKDAFLAWVMKHSPGTVVQVHP